jgi:hypothetical protein
MHKWVQGTATARAGVYIVALDMLSCSRSAGDLPARKTQRIS